MCGTGVISYGAGYRLARTGHPRVRVVQGGYNAWRGLYPELLSRLRVGASAAARLISLDQGP